MDRNTSGPGARSWGLGGSGIFPRVEGPPIVVTSGPTVMHRRRHSHQGHSAEVSVALFSGLSKYTRSVHKDVRGPNERKATSIPRPYLEHATSPELQTNL